MLRSPLAVRVANNAFDSHITRLIEDVEFTTAALGGFDTCSFELNRPITDTPGELAVESRVYVYDTRNGRTIWEGKLTDPGRSYSDAGHQWSMTAMGPKKHASDRFSPYMPIDRTLDAFWRKNNQSPGATAGPGSNPGDTNDDKSLLFQFPGGMVVGNNSIVSLAYEQLQDNGLLLGGFAYDYVMGANLASYELQVTVEGTLIRNQAFTTTPGTAAASSAGSAFTLGGDSLTVRINRVSGGATTIAADNIWAAASNFWVRGLMYDKTGAQISGAGTYSNDYVTVAEVVADLLGRFLPDYDGANATIDSSTFHIDQLAYPDGVRPADVFDDLILTTPTRRWAAWESNDAGKYRFEWTKWGTSPRYEVGVDDGVDLPGSSADLYNRVTVTGTDARDRKQSVICTSTVPELGSTVREAEPINLGTEGFSTANATQIGTQFLVNAATPPASGTLTVRRSIRDTLTGRLVAPWEIRAGSLIRVRGLFPTSSGVTATDMDGQSVFRLVATSFRDSDQAASLTLDSPSFSVDQLIARLARRRQRH